MSIGDNIKAIRIQNHMTLEEIAQKVGVSRQTIQRYESGVISNIPSDNIEKIAVAMGISLADIMGWSSTPSIPHAKNIIPMNTERVPLVGRIAAGKPILAEQNIDGYENLAGGVHADFCVEVHGDSMIGANIHNGDIVFIRQQNDVENGEIAAVLIDDSATLKRFYHDGDSVALIAENPKYPPMIFHNGDCEKFEILGKAVALQTLIK